jgi:hypothetical protein
MNRYRNAETERESERERERERDANENATKYTHTEHIQYIYTVQTSSNNLTVYKYVQ